MKRKPLEELNLLDDFLFQELISRGKKGEEVCRILLSTILGKTIGRVKVAPQKPILGMDTTLHGIRMDAYIEATEEGAEAEVEPDIYDIEPDKTRERATLPKRTRFYGSLIDTRLLESGAGYESLKNVIIIMILPYDPFDENLMVYTMKTQCVEKPEIPYEDGIQKIYLYTRGTGGTPSQKLKEMLKYMENSTIENVTNQEIASIHEYINEVKHDKEVGIQYMKTWEREDRIRRESMEKGREEGKKEGKKEGREEGREEEKKAVIRNMLNHGMPEEDICKLVNCTKELIKKTMNQQ